MSHYMRRRLAPEQQKIQIPSFETSRLNRDQRAVIGEVLQQRKEAAFAGELFLL
jgi:hypothetical protein